MLPYRRLVAQEDAARLAAPHIPEADGAVGAAAGHIVAVGVPPHNIHIRLVTCTRAATGWKMCTHSGQCRMTCWPALLDARQWAPCMLRLQSLTEAVPTPPVQQVQACLLLTSRSSCDVLPAQAPSSSACCACAATNCRGGTSSHATPVRMRSGCARSVLHRRAVLSADALAK